MTNTEEVKAKLDALSPKELEEVARFIDQQAKREAERRALIESLCGKYREILRPSEDYMAAKAEEKKLEERRW